MTVHLITPAAAAKAAQQLFPGSDRRPFLGAKGGLSFEEADGGEIEISPELEEILQLATFPTSVLHMTSSPPGSAEALTKVFVIDGRNAMAVRPHVEGWEVSDVVELEKLVWRFIDAVGATTHDADEPFMLDADALASLEFLRSRGFDLTDSTTLIPAAEVTLNFESDVDPVALLAERGYLTENGDEFEFGPSLTEELAELIQGARVTIRRSTIPSGTSPDLLFEAATAFGETVTFAGPLGRMHYMLSEDGERFAFSRFDEEELVALLELVTGPVIEPPVLPVETLTAGTARLLADDGVERRTVAAHAGRLNNIGIAASEARLENGTASEWQLTLMRPEVVVSMERYPGDATHAITHHVSLAGNSAVVWSNAAGGTDFQLFKAGTFGGQIADWLDLLTFECPVAKPAPREFSVSADDFLAGPASWNLPEFGSQEAEHGGTIHRGRIEMLFKTADGLVLGEELELVAIDHYGAFSCEPLNESTWLIRELNTDDMVRAILASTSQTAVSER